MKLKQIGLLAALILGTATLLYVAAYLYLYASIASTLATTKQDIEPVAYLDYGPVRVGPLGDIELDDLELVPLESGRAIAIDRIALSSSNPLWLPLGVNLRHMAVPDLPARVSLDLIGLKMLREDLAAGLLPEVPAGTAAPSIGRRLLAGVCGFDAGESTLRYLDRVLPKELLLDLQVQLKAGPGGGADVLDLWVDLRGVGRFQVSLVANVAQVMASTGAATEPSVRSLDLNSRLNGEFLALAKQTCASMGGTSAAAVDRRLREDADRIFGDVLGMVPGDALLDALQDYLAGKELQLLFDPTALALIDRYPPEDVAGVVALRVYVDGEQLPKPNFRAPKVETALVDTDEADADALAHPGDIIDSELLARCLGCTITVRLKDGRERRGIADALNASTLYVKWDAPAYFENPWRSSARKGSVTAELARADIEWIRFEAPPR